MSPKRRKTERRAMTAAALAQQAGQPLPPGLEGMKLVRAASTREVWICERCHKKFELTTRNMAPIKQHAQEDCTAVASAAPSSAAARDAHRPATRSTVGSSSRTDPSPAFGSGQQGSGSGSVSASASAPGPGPGPAPTPASSASTPDTPAPATTRSRTSTASTTSLRSGKEAHMDIDAHALPPPPPPQSSASNSHSGSALRSKGKALTTPSQSAAPASDRTANRKRDRQELTDDYDEVYDEDDDEDGENNGDNDEADQTATQGSSASHELEWFQPPRRNASATAPAPLKSAFARPPGTSASNGPVGGPASDSHPFFPNGHSQGASSGLRGSNVFDTQTGANPNADPSSSSNNHALPSSSLTARARISTSHTQLASDKLREAIDALRFQQAEIFQVLEPLLASSHEIGQSILQLEDQLQRLGGVIDKHHRRQLFIMPGLLRSTLLAFGLLAVAATARDTTFPACDAPVKAGAPAGEPSKVFTSTNKPFYVAPGTGACLRPGWVNSAYTNTCGKQIKATNLKNGKTAVMNVVDVCGATADLASKCSDINFTKQTFIDLGGNVTIGTLDSNVKWQFVQ
ncbi:hypothetical protein OC842_003738 [Tilletia horrida]|uniref:Uncharacterized protein n=1 Tax=Tilletia horrida TaxID=155126 RepID=A0AAN6GB78_9BASI|nr:hypothetical protein OC842_003738 [Tilletia horrida]